MKKLEMNQMAAIEGGTDGVGIACAVLSVGGFFAGLFTGGLGFVIGNAIQTGFCAGWGIASATT